MILKIGNKINIKTVSMRAQPKRGVIFAKIALLVFVCLGICGLAFWGVKLIHAEDTKYGSVQQKGLKFNLPAEDWPIENRGGVIAPIPVEEYIAKKFKSIESEIGSMKDELSKKFDDVKYRLDTLEKNVTTSPVETNVSDSKLQPAAPSDAQKINPELQAIKDNFGSLSADVKSQLSAYESRFQSIEEQVWNLEQRLYLLISQFEDAQEQNKKMRR